jgi:predicted component of type VI protein secretion system
MASSGQHLMAWGFGGGIIPGMGLFVLRVAVAGALVVVCGCSAADNTAKPPVAVTVTVTPTPTISWDQRGRDACDEAASDAWLVALANAKMSLIRDLQDVALREEQLGNNGLIKAWCAEHYRP